MRRSRLHLSGLRCFISNNLSDEMHHAFFRVPLTAAGRDGEAVGPPRDRRQPIAVDFVVAVKLLESGFPPAEGFEELSLVSIHARTSSSAISEMNVRPTLATRRA